MSDVVDKVTLDSDDYIKELRRIAANMDKMAEQADRDFNKIEREGSKAFKDVGDAAEKAGKKGKVSFDALKVVIAGVAGVVAGLAAGVVAAFGAAEEGLNTVRIRRSFRNLAAGVGQDSNEILAAMQKASAGTVAEMQLISSATEALNFRIAKTPEEFARLTDSALKLARIKGIPVAEALSRLTGGLGRREVELLDELGLNLVAINAEMEKVAQREFGKAASELSAVQRESIFAEAALNAAAISAQRLGGGIEDIGSSLDKTSANIANFQADVNEAFTLLVGRSLELAQQMGKDLFGSAGIFQTGGNVVAQVFAATLATFLSVAGTIAEKVNEARQVFQGELGIGAFIAGLTPGGIAKDVSKNFDAAFAKLKTDFAEILAPETVAPTVTAGTGILPPPEVVDEEADELAKKVEAAQERLTEIERDGARDRLDNALKAGRERLDAEAGFVQKRIDQARKYLQQVDDAERDLARDLDDITRDQAREQLQAEREAAQARLDNELNYQRELARIRTRFTADLESAARARDAVQFLQLQRQQQQELDQARTTRDQQQQDSATEASRRREELRINQQAEIDDANLANQRKLEDLRLANEREVEELTINEERKRAELALSNERRLADLQTAYGRQLADFKASLEAEVLALLEAEDRKTEIVREAVARRAALDRRQQARIDEQVSQGRTVIAGRASGGPIAANSAYLVGEKGPEIIVPQSAGYVIPNTSPLMMNTLPSQINTTNITNDFRRQGSLGVVDPGSLDAIVQMKVTNALNNILGGLL